MILFSASVRFGFPYNSISSLSGRKFLKESNKTNPHWSMYTSLCRYLGVLPVRHTPIFWNKMAAKHLLTAEVVSVFIFVVVNTA